MRVGFTVVSTNRNSQLSRRKITLPGPLIRLGKITVVSHLVRVFMHGKTSGIIIVVGGRDPLAGRRLTGLRTRTRVPLRMIIGAAPDSVRDFCRLDPCLRSSGFYLAAISAVFHRRRFSAFVRAFGRSRASKCVTMASFVSSRGPLCVSASDTLSVANFRSRTAPRYHCVSKNVCYLAPTTIGALRKYVRGNVSHVHGFRQRLMTSNLGLGTCPFAGVLSMSRTNSVIGTRGFLTNGRRWLGRGEEGKYGFGGENGP